MLKKFLQRFFSGISIGILIGLGISIGFSYASGTGLYYPSTPQFMDQFSNQNTAMLVSLFLWGLIGGIASAASMIFEYTDWSITKMTVVHCILLYLIYLIISVFCKWFPVTLFSVGIFTGIYLGIYLIMWFVFMKIAKNQIEKINRTLEG